jgi:hypothetical protein
VIHLFVELGEEERAKMKSSSTRNGLERDNLFELERPLNVNVRTLFSLMAVLSAPTISFWEALVNWARPAMGRYSLLASGSLKMMPSA